MDTSKFYRRTIYEVRNKYSGATLIAFTERLDAVAYIDSREELHIVGTTMYSRTPNMRIADHPSC